MQPTNLTTSDLARFWAKVDKQQDDCWPWLGWRNHKGYGYLSIDRGKVSAHRLAWTLANGREVPEGLELDHLCRNRDCVNPDHLEPVTHRENNLRRTRLITHCPSGHEYTDETTLHRGDGRRACRTCRDTPTPCDLCGKAVVKRNLRRHMRTHENGPVR